VLRDFRFRIQPVLVGSQKHFQVRIGLDGLKEVEFVPAHQSAFALKFPLKEHHPSEHEALGERDALLEWLRRETGTRRESAA
jgi:hypothetical protein